MPLPQKIHAIIQVVMRYREYPKMYFLDLHVGLSCEATKALLAGLGAGSHGQTRLKRCILRTNWYEN
jgi:hypothetical protein